MLNRAPLLDLAPLVGSLTSGQRRMAFPRLPLGRPTLYGTNNFNKIHDTTCFDNVFVGAPGGFNFAFLGDRARYGIDATYHW